MLRPIGPVSRENSRQTGELAGLTTWIRNPASGQMVTSDDFVEVTTVRGPDGAKMLEDEGRERRQGQLERRRRRTPPSAGWLVDVKLTLQSFRVPLRGLGV
jgi:hypothetical protein